MNSVIPTSGNTNCRLPLIEWRKLVMGAVSLFWLLPVWGVKSSAGAEAPRASPSALADLVVTGFDIPLRIRLVATRDGIG